VNLNTVFIDAMRNLKTHYLKTFIIVAVSLLLLLPQLALAQSTPNPKTDLNQALNITELKISMAESSLKVNPSLRTLAELAAALEDYLNNNCFGQLLSTLKYDGPPTDPNCISKMERLLSFYPNNPVAVCLRDGIAAPSCENAYNVQELRAFTSSDSAADPALKVGLSAQDEAKVKALSETLANVNRDYQSAQQVADKQKLMDDAAQLYDQLLSVTCKLYSLKLEQPQGAKDEPTEDPSIREVRERLLKIPPALRGDYQNQLLTQAEEELGRAASDKARQALILERIKVIQNPDNRQTLTAADKERIRIVLPRCKELIEQSAKILPHLPSPICHRQGWRSPQCVKAIEGWHRYRAKVAEESRKRGERNAVVATPAPIISSF
jgi:hypothetical protein